MAEGTFYICACFFHRNIFLKRFTLHVHFFSEEQFREDYHELFRRKGCGEEDMKEIIQEVSRSLLNASGRVKTEITRRRNRGAEHVHRCQLVKQKYQKLHQSVYVLSEEVFHREFLHMVHYCLSSGASRDGLLRLLRSENAPRVYSFPLFTASFCERLLEELEHFEQSEIPKGRPNTMNNTGILLSELGFDEGFMNTFRSQYLLPIATLLFPECVGVGLDSHRAFVVTYSANSKLGDVGLSTHYDNAEVTLNVCLGKEFHEGELFFENMKDVPITEPRPHIYDHVIGRAVLHRGQHMHGAFDIQEGERYNLIIWMRSSSVRNKCCPRCGEPPTLVPFTGYGDGFTAEPLSHQHS